VPAEGSYLSRFVVKFVEIIAAGFATAIGGYLLAHFGGVLTGSPPPAQPAAVQVGPAPVQEALPGMPSPANTSSVPKSAAATPAADPEPAAQQDATPASAPSARKSANAAKGSRKNAKTEAAKSEGTKTDAGKPDAAKMDAAKIDAAKTDAAKADSTSESKSAKAEPPKTESPEAKARDDASVESQVRAALANVDANKPAGANVPPRRGDVQPGVAPVGVQPMTPVNGPQGATTASVSRATDVAPASVPAQAPVQAAPLTTVEIKSRPVTDIDAQTPPAAAPAAEEDKSLWSALKHFPEMLRTDAHPPTGEAPRPPSSVGGE
jgi:hypothetical protein